MDGELNQTLPVHFSLYYCLDQPYLNNYKYGGAIFIIGRAILDIFLSISVIIVNFVLIFAIIFYRRRNRGTVRVYNSGTSMKFVLMLAFSDVLVALTVPIYLVPHYFCFINDLIRNYELLCMSKYVGSVFSALMSNCSLISIAVDRYIAIQYTLKYRMIMTHRLCLIMILVQVLFSAIASSVLFVWNHWEHGSYCDLEDVVPTSYVLTLGVITHSIIVVAIVGVHIRMHQKAAESNSRKNIMELRITKETTHSIKSAKVVVLVAGLYILCWTPYSICLMLRVSSQGRDSLYEFLFQLTFPLSIGNSLVNPFIYAWKNSEIQNAVKWSIRRASF